jgi:hypothetical protein
VAVQSFKLLRRCDPGLPTAVKRICGSVCAGDIWYVSLEPVKGRKQMEVWRTSCVVSQDSGEYEALALTLTSKRRAPMPQTASHRSTIALSCVCGRMFKVRPSNATQRIDHLYDFLHNSSMTQRKHPWALRSLARRDQVSLRHGTDRAWFRASRSMQTRMSEIFLFTLLEPGTLCLVYGMPHAFRPDPYTHTHRPLLHFSYIPRKHASETTALQGARPGYV